MSKPTRKRNAPPSETGRSTASDATDNRQLNKAQATFRGRSVSVFKNKLGRDRATKQRRAAVVHVWRRLPEKPYGVPSRNGINWLLPQSNSTPWGRTWRSTPTIASVIGR